MNTERYVIITCWACKRSARKPYDAVPMGANTRLKCGRCGAKGADTAHIVAVSKPPESVRWEDPRRPKREHEQKRR